MKTYTQEYKKLQLIMYCITTNKKIITNGLTKQWKKSIHETFLSFNFVLPKY